MSKFKKVLITVGVCIFAFLIFIAVMSHWETYKMRKEGDKVIAKVEEFQKVNGRLPTSRKEMGLEDTESSRPLYEVWDSESYKLTFPIGFDDSYVYYSKFKSWENEP